MSYRYHFSSFSAGSANQFLKTSIHAEFQKKTGIKPIDSSYRHPVAISHQRHYNPYQVFFV